MVAMRALYIKPVKGLMFKTLTCRCFVARKGIEAHDARKKMNGLVFRGKEVTGEIECKSG
jgi:hypothetical protein